MGRCVSTVSACYAATASNRFRSFVLKIMPADAPLGGIGTAAGRQARVGAHMSSGEVGAASLAGDAASITEARKADWPAALDAALSELQLAGRVSAGSTSRWLSKERLTSSSALAEVRQKYTADGVGACRAPGCS